MGVIVMLGVATRPARADDIPPELEMAIHLKILSFDSGLKDRVTGDTITIAILHTGDRRSLANDYVNAVSTLSDKNSVTVHGKKVRAVAIPIAADLSDQLAKVSALYIVGGVGSDQVAAIARIAQSKKLPTLSGDRNYLSSGVAVAVVEKSGKPGIVVHAGNAKDCGMVLDSKLLRLAEVVK
jgi:hypothetical protein